MPDRISKQARSEVMAKVLSSGNRSTEGKFVTVLKGAKIHGWRRRIKIFGRPDFVFRSCRLAVFLDGCFWHRCPNCYRRPRSNTFYWDKKVAHNVRRDNLVNQTLSTKGWHVFRIWEHELKRDNIPGCIKRLKKAIIRYSPALFIGTKRST